MRAPYLVAFAVYDDNGLPLLDAPLGFRAWAAPGGSEAGPAPDLLDLGGGLYGFGYDGTGGRAYLIATGANPSHYSGAVGDDLFRAFALFNASGVPAPVAVPAFASYVDREGNARARPAIQNLGDGLYGFDASEADAAAGVAFEIVSGAYPERLAGTVNESGGGEVFDPADPSPPVVAGLSPEPGTPIVPGSALGFDVTTATGIPLRHIVILVTYRGLSTSEVVFDGAAFAPAFRHANSSRSTITGGERFRFARVGGWPASPQIQIRAVTWAGVENA